MTSGAIAWSLAAVSVAWGVLAFLVFRRFTDPLALRRVRKRLYAHLLGIRLFSEEPVLVWEAQKALVADNLRFLALVAKPVLMMAIPFALLYGPLDSIYGWGPLEVGHSAIVTYQLSGEATAGEAHFTLLAPPGIAVESPPIAVPAENQISWRIRPLVPARGNLRIIARGVGGEVSVPVASGERLLSFYRRHASLTGGFWVDIDYPKADVTIAGLSLPWLAWFLLISTASAVLCLFRPGRRPF